MRLEKQAIDEKVKDFKEKYRFFRYETDAEFDLYKKDKPHCVSVFIVITFHLRSKIYIL